MNRARPIQHTEGGDEQRGWVCMALFNVYGVGPTRQAAWDLLVARLREAIK